MNKVRYGGAKHRIRTSRWNMQTASQRKSMSLHDLTEVPTESFSNISPNQNTSILTLDSIPKSRDSGLSRSASRLSLPNIAESTPRSPTIHDLKYRVDELEETIKELDELLKEKDKELQQTSSKYRSLFVEHHALQLKYAALLNDVDRIRIELYNKNSDLAAQVIAVSMKKSQTHDGLFSEYNHDDSLRRASLLSDSEMSASEQAEDSASSLNHMVSSSKSDEEIQHETVWNLQSREELSISIPVTPVPPEIQEQEDQVLALPSASLSSQGSIMLPRRENWTAFRREEIVLSPVPSSGKWTLDKSMQLVSDSDVSDISEPGEEEEKSASLSMHTEETTIMSHAKSEETLRGTDFEEVNLPMSLDDTHLSFLKLPTDSSEKKVQSWRDVHWPQNNSIVWSQCKKGRPQNLSVTQSPAIQRLRSPQNLSLLSPRPFQKQESSVVMNLFQSGPFVVPPLDLSALHSHEESQSAVSTEQSSSSHQELTSGNNSYTTSCQLLERVPEIDVKKVEQILKMTNRNLDFSRKLLKKLGEDYQVSK